ncbi:lipoprotein, partial [Mesorhizobium sp.]
MKKIVLAATAVLALSGAAFAGSDNYGSAGASQQA